MDPFSCAKKYSIWNCIYMIFILPMLNIFQQFQKCQQLNMNIDTIFDKNYKNPHTAFEAIDFPFFFFKTSQIP